MIKSKQENIIFIQLQNNLNFTKIFYENIKIFHYFNYNFTRNLNEYLNEIFKIYDKMKRRQQLSFKNFHLLFFDISNKKPSIKEIFR